MAKSKGPKVYAVARGRVPGIYSTWDQCKAQTSGFSGAIFKSFKTRGEAEAFIQSNSSSSSAPATASDASAGQKRARDHGDNTATTLQKKTAIQPSNASSISNNGNDSQLQITIHFDGGSRGNPGVAGAGAQVVVVDTTNKNKTATYSIREFCGNRATNNYAEYKGLIAGLKQAKTCIEQYEAKSPLHKTIPLFKLQVYGDSNLIIQQLRGAWECKNPNILPLFRQSKKLIREMKCIDGTGLVLLDHVYRDQNKIADALANEAMDRRECWITTTTGDDAPTDDEASHDERKPSATGNANALVSGNHSRNQVAASTSTKQEVINVDDSDDDSHYSV